MGRLVKRNTLSGLAAPATAALAGQHLYVVNTRFNRMDTNDAASPPYHEQGAAGDRDGGLMRMRVTPP